MTNFLRSVRRESFLAVAVPAPFPSSMEALEELTPLSLPLTNIGILYREEPRLPAILLPLYLVIPLRRIGKKLPMDTQFLTPVAPRRTRRQIAYDNSPNLPPLLLNMKRQEDKLMNTYTAGQSQPTSLVPT